MKLSVPNILVCAEIGIAAFVIAFIVGYALVAGRTFFINRSFRHRIENELGNCHGQESIEESREEGQ